jgi:catechol 2,3-dioxygenase-like lactoylglutathione lyase family enzyme
MPADSRSNDRWFQHICMVTNNLSSVYTDDLRKSSEAISTAIQTLPNWNAAAAGIQAVKLKDPLGHPLELLQFPDDKGNQRWHGLATDLGRPLGIDHTAIGISNTRNSVVFYRDLLGLVVGGTSHNHGKEQDGLDGLSEIQVEITSFRPTGQPLGIELLNYLQPEGGRERSNPRPTDINEWRIIIDCENLDELHAVMKGSELVNSCGPVVDVQQEFCGRPRGFVVRDPDQHALVLVGE